MPRTRKSSPRPLAKARTKQQIIAVLRSVARKLGHTPTCVELYLLTGISRSQVAWRFQGYRAAVRAAGLEPENNGVRIETAALLHDWGTVLRQVDAVPSGREYEQAGRYSRFAFYERLRDGRPYRLHSANPSPPARSLAIGPMCWKSSGAAPYQPAVDARGSRK
jgi:hypothetical protein